MILILKNVELLQYSLHKIKLKRGGSHIKSPKWIRSKGAAINLKDEDDNNCFQYAITIALNHQNVENHPEKYQMLNHLLTNIIKEI